MTHTEASAETLLRQAGLAAAEYLDAAVLHIDNKFGDGFAERHPNPAGAFIHAAVSDENAATVAQVIGEAIETVAAAIHRNEP